MLYGVAYVPIARPATLFLETQDRDEGQCLVTRAVSAPFHLTPCLPTDAEFQLIVTLTARREGDGALTASTPRLSLPG